jgi:hypothetical protein
VRALADEALLCERPGAVRRLLDAAHRDMGLDGLAPGPRSLVLQGPPTQSPATVG